MKCPDCKGTGKDPDADFNDELYICITCFGEGEIPNHLCPNCNGSGEGMHDGTKCSQCKGTGEEK